MSILLERQPEIPLQQGDILADIETSYTDYFTGTPSESMPTEIGMVLVLSRPCKAIRDEFVVVAPVIEKNLSGIGGLDTYDKLMGFLEDIRDGVEKIDTFYLGELVAGSNRRFVAKLDQVRMIRLPKGEKSEARIAFIAKHRRFGLSEAFQRDLHLRLFRSFATLGFDDNRWWSDDDLKLILSTADAEIETLRAKMRTIEATDERFAIEGDSNRSNSNKKEIQAAQKRIEKIMEATRLLRDEFRTRTPSSGG